MSRNCSAEEAEEYAASALQLRDYQYTYKIVYEPATAMEVEIRFEFGDMPILGYSPLSLLGQNMAARVVMPSDVMTFSTPGKGGGSGGGKGT